MSVYGRWAHVAGRPKLPKSELLESKGETPRNEAQQVWDTEACLARARAVRNTMTTAESTLRSADMPASLRGRATEMIDTAWRALARRSVDTENRLRLLEAIDNAARTTDREGALGEAVLTLLPPELLMVFAPHTDALGRVVKAWRKRTPGRGHTQGKWRECTALWKTSTGEATTAEAWETTWKSARRRRAKAIREALATAGSRASPAGD